LRIFIVSFTAAAEFRGIAVNSASHERPALVADLAVGREIYFDEIRNRPFRAELTVVPNVAGVGFAKRKIRRGKVDHAVRMIRRPRSAAVRTGEERLRRVNFSNRQTVYNERLRTVETVEDARPNYRHISV
jgi:hypothetical protein